jgi:PAS domain S-box-containing protein
MPKALRASIVAVDKSLPPGEVEIPEHRPHAALTPRELEVLKRRSTGASVKQVASELGITTHAVNKHSSGAYRKLGATNIGTAVVAARRRNLIPAVTPYDATAADQRIFDSLPAGIYAKDLAGRYTLCNRLAAARVGLTAAEVLGRAAEDIMELATAKQVRAADERAITDGRAEYKIVIGERTYLDRKSALYTDDGKVSGVCGVAVDVTSTPDPGHQHAMVLDVLTTLVRTADPRHPGISALLDAQIRELWREVGDGALELASIQEHFIRTGTDRYEARAMLEFLVNSRDADPAPATWNAAVREVADVLRYERSAGIHVVAHLHLYEGTLIASRQRMSAIVMNLAFNAIDAMPNGGELSISTYETDTHSCLAVQDTGVGIPPEVREHIFEPAFTTKGERGTGVGLYAVKRFVDDAHGTISVESDSGAGTKVTVCLPLLREPVDAGQ